MIISLLQHLQSPFFCLISGNVHLIMNYNIPPILSLIWQIFAGISLALFILSFIFILIDRKLPDREKVLWLLGTLLLPILGPILFLTLGRHGK